MTAAISFDEKRKVISSALAKRADSYEMVLPPVLGFDRFQLAIMSEIGRTPTLANCTTASIVMASFDAAKLGLEINSVLGEAYLVPFKRRLKGGGIVEEAKLIIGYRGFTTLALQSPRVLSLTSEVVLDVDKFEHEAGTSPRIVHQPGDRTRMDVRLGSDVRAAYAIATLCSPGSPAIAQILNVMHRAELEHIRGHSKGGDRPDSPWNNHRPRMYRKCPIRRMAADLPLSDGMRHALLVDGDAERTREERDRHASLRKKVAADLDVEIVDAEVDQDDGPQHE